MCRQAELDAGADDLSRGIRREVFLPEVQAKTKERGIVGTVIQNQVGPDAGAGFELCYEVAIEWSLMCRICTQGRWPQASTTSSRRCRCRANRAVSRIA